MMGARSLGWRVLLYFDTLDDRHWLASLERSREVYDSFRTRYLAALQHPEEDLDDPLSEGVDVSEAPHRRRTGCLTRD